VNFEYDPAKSVANAEKHGIDFEEAQFIWKDGRAVELETIAYGNEQRSLIVGELDGKCWTAVVTNRAGLVRIISVRRSRSKERQAHLRGGV
jgi:uncharacterized DUF497 family protein